MGPASTEPRTRQGSSLSAPVPGLPESRGIAWLHALIATMKPAVASDASQRDGFGTRSCGAMGKGGSRIGELRVCITAAKFVRCTTDVTRHFC